MAGTPHLKVLVTAVSLVVLVAGCSKTDEYAAVRGQVFYNDQPLGQGVVMFQPAAGPPARGTIQSDGTFELETVDRGAGARIGTNRVRISARELPKNYDTEIGLGKTLIPLRYNDIATSGLTAEVKGDSNEPFVFHLKD
jgi:hypothetical protein